MHKQKMYKHKKTMNNEETQKYKCTIRKQTQKAERVRPKFDLCYRGKRAKKSDWFQHTNQGTNMRKQTNRETQTRF